MKKGFWEKLHKPFFVLAPMADVTDAAFRRLISSVGKPSVMWTEFLSADGLFLGGEHARNILMKGLIYSEDERPIVAQFFSAKPNIMEKVARLAVKLGFDGVDINMGCPDRSIERQGAGAALIKNPRLAQEIILATKAGAGNLPVSIKTRIGYNENELDTWLPLLLDTEPVAITLHARTRREMSKVPAHWNEIKRAVDIRNSLESDCLIIGNGDVMTLEEAEEKAEETGADGIMLGKAIFGNPWLFAVPPHTPTVEEKLRMMLRHTKLFSELLPDKNFAIMKKHYKAYANGFSGARELREKLMKASTTMEVEKITEHFLQTL